MPIEAATAALQSRRFLWLYALASAGGSIAYVPFLTILLPMRVTAMAGTDDVAWLAYATFFGAIAASLSGIAFGWASDATRRRVPWIAGGLLLSSLLLGSFGTLLALGFSINVLTMFGMVLVIGIVVDDAIVVVENVERVMSEEGLSPKEATRKSMDEITPALVGIALVLSAVFIPMAFFGGSTGVIYRQFSITIVSAMVLSVLVALTLTPALCATLLKPIEKGSHTSHGAPRKGMLGGVDRFFAGFNRRFDRTADRYQGFVGAIVRRGKEVVYEGTVVGLKRFKDDVREVQQGYECGINLDWNDVMEGDIIEASEMVEVIPA